MYTHIPHTYHLHLLYISTHIYMFIHTHFLGLVHQAVSQEKSIADMLGAGNQGSWMNFIEIMGHHLISAIFRLDIFVLNDGKKSG